MTRKLMESAAPSAAQTVFADVDRVDPVPFPQAERASLGTLTAADASAAPDHDPPALDAAILDERGHDPAAYCWVPVLRKRRADGWSPGKQRRFIEELADTGLIVEAARAVDMSPASCYRLRRAPGAESFATAWDAAIHQASNRLVDLAFDRAINGSDEPVFDASGARIGRRMRTNDRLLMFLLRAHQPDRYGRTHPDMRGKARAPGAEPCPAPRAAPSVAPIADAIATLEPVAPPDPHLLMAPDELDSALVVADMMDGALPHWHRDPPPETHDDSGVGPLGEAFERGLEAAKRVAWGLPPEPGSQDRDDPFLA